VRGARERRREIPLEGAILVVRLDAGCLAGLTSDRLGEALDVDDSRTFNPN
jgi:hypothetical protein